MSRPAQRFYDEASRDDPLVWRICEYLRIQRTKQVGVLDDCQRCPAWTEDTDHGRCKRGCRALAEEVVAVVSEAAALKAQAT